MKNMKKLHFMVILLAVLSLGLLFPSTLLAADEEVDQSFLPDEAVGWQNINMIGPLGQEFIPTKSVLTSVDVDISPMLGASGTYTLTMNIRQVNVS